MIDVVTHRLALVLQIAGHPGVVDHNRDRRVIADGQLVKKGRQFVRQVGAVGAGEDVDVVVKKNFQMKSLILRRNKILFLLTK